MKNLLNMILILLVLATFILSSSYSYAIEKSFFEISNLEVSQNDKIEMIINLDQIKYKKFVFELTASEDTEKLEIAGNEITNNSTSKNEGIEITNNATTSLKEGIEIEKSGNEITMEIDKETNNLDTIVLYYKVPQNLNVKDKIKFIATITNLESTEKETQTVEKEVKIVENKSEESDEKKEDSNSNDKNNQNRK